MALKRATNVPIPATLLTVHLKFRTRNIQSNQQVQHFAEVGSKLASNIHSPASFSDSLQNQHPNSIFLSPINDSEIVDIVRNFKRGKSAGYDNISPTVIKDTLPTYLQAPITYIFNLSLSSGVFPSALKIAMVVPIFKKAWRSSHFLQLPSHLPSMFL